MVTRRPLEMRLVYKPKHEISAPYAIFDERKGTTFTDFGKVKDMIQTLTD